MSCNCRLQSVAFHSFDFFQIFVLFFQIFDCRVILFSFDNFVTVFGCSIVANYMSKMFGFSVLSSF